MVAVPSLVVGCEELTPASASRVPFAEVVVGDDTGAEADDEAGDDADEDDDDADVDDDEEEPVGADAPYAACIASR